MKIQSAIAIITTLVSAVDAGKNTTQAPTPTVTRPVDETTPPLTPFPTESTPMTSPPESTIPETSPPVRVLPLSSIVCIVVYVFEVVGRMHILLPRREVVSVRAREIERDRVFALHGRCGGGLMAVLIMWMTRQCGTRRECRLW